MTKIMIIEDDFDNRELLAECLRAENYEVSTFENGSSALENLEGNDFPDLLLMDLCFPLFSAEDFVRSFHEKTGHKDIPIIVLSGKPDIRMVSEKINARTFLQKPYDLYKLYEAISSALNESQDNHDSRAA